MSMRKNTHSDAEGRAGHVYDTPHTDTYCFTSDVRSDRSAIATADDPVAKSSNLHTLVSALL